VSIVYLAPDGNDANTCATPATRCVTLGRGLAQLAAGGELRLASGTYTGTTTLTRPATISGGFALPNFTPGAPPATLDGQGLGSTLQITGAISVRLAQLTITGGVASTNDSTVGRGGGIAINGAVVMLDRVLVQQNIGAFDGSGEGGGISIRGGTLNLLSSQIISNTATLLRSILSPLVAADTSLLPQPIQAVSGSGGGIFAQDARVAIRQSTLKGNSALGGTASPHLETSALGGALYADRSTIETFETLFLHNNAQAIASQAGALKLIDSQARLRGGEISDNSAGPASGSSSGGALDIVGGHVSLASLALRRNLAADGAGIRLAPSRQISSTAQLTLTNVLLAEHASAALALPTPQSGTAQATLRYTSVISNSIGVLAGTGQAISITHSLLISNTVAAQAAAGSAVTLSYTDRYSNTLDTDGTLQLGPAGDLALAPHFRRNDNAFHLAPSSPLIDMGIPLAGIPNDFESQPRTYDGDGDGTARPDLGWDEMVRSAAQFGPNLTVFARPGQLVNATLDLYNVGDGDDTFQLSTAAPGGWVVMVQPTQTTLGPHTQTQLTISLTVPASAPPNSQTSIQVRAVGASSQATATLLIVVGS
jgi:hypothetical protein